MRVLDYSNSVFRHNTCPELDTTEKTCFFLHPPFMYSHWRYSHELLCRLSSPSLSLSYRRDAPVLSSPSRPFAQHSLLDVDSAVLTLISLSLALKWNPTTSLLLGGGTVVQETLQYNLFHLCVWICCYYAISTWDRWFLTQSRTAAVCQGCTPLTMAHTETPKSRGARKKLGWLSSSSCCVLPVTQPEARANKQSCKLSYHLTNTPLVEGQASSRIRWSNACWHMLP